MRRGRIVRTGMPVWLILCLGSAPVRAEAGEALRVVICYPGGSVRESEAKPGMGSMLEVVERLGGWQQGTINNHFTSDLAKCRKMLAGLQPHFAIMSLGLFLESQEDSHLVPLVQPRIQGRVTDRYYVLVRKGRFAALADLKDKTVGGTHLLETPFLYRIVFRGQLDPASHFRLKPSRGALRALRRLAAGRLDAVIVNEQQYNSLPSLPFSPELEAIFASEPVPLAGVAANESRTTAQDRSRMTEALVSMCRDAQGKKMCELFGIDGFVTVGPQAYEAVHQLWSGHK